jgi:hypothetical protein
LVLPQRADSAPPNAIICNSQWAVHNDTRENSLSGFVGMCKLDSVIIGCNDHDSASIVIIKTDNLTHTTTKADHDPDILISSL